MALITCPECQKEFSVYAEACPHCGYPVDVKTRQLSIIKSNWKLYETNFSKNRDVKSQSRFYFGTLVNDLKLYKPVNEKQERFIVGFFEGYFGKLERYLYDTPEKLQFTMSYFNNCLMKELNDNPHCPNCNSYVVSQISNFSRSIGIGMWGMASSKVGKTYRCKECGYTW